MSTGAFQREQNIVIWTDQNGALPVIKAIMGSEHFNIEVDQPEQVRNWEKVLNLSAAEDADKEVTLAIITAAIQIIAILSLAGVLAYAIGRGYRITAKKTPKGTMQFELERRQA